MSKGVDFMSINIETESEQETSHTIKIYNEAHYEISKFLNQNSKLESYIAKVYSSKGRFITFLNNKVFNKLGFLIFENTFWDFVTLFFYDSSAKSIATEIMYYGFTQSKTLDDVYSLFTDEESRKVFDWFLKYRFGYAIMGPLAQDVFPYPNFTRNPRNHNLSLVKHKRYLCTVNGYVINFQRYFLIEVENAWINEQYLLPGKCEPEPGDIVIDAGGFLGETAIWFADKIGESGKVHSFEPLESNYRRMKRNICRNHLEQIITVTNEGLWNINTDLFITNRLLSASYCSTDHGDMKIKVTTLDTYVQEKKLERVNFIKMDIEGAELNALKGAVATITKFKPKLAISIYHLPGDIYEIPFFIKSLVPEYNLYLSHKFKGWNETILFAAIN
jgi:FkbM family methyltransferase